MDRPIKDLWCGECNGGGGPFIGPGNWGCWQCEGTGISLHKLKAWIHVPGNDPQKVLYNNYDFENMKHTLRPVAYLVERWIFGQRPPQLDLTLHTYKPTIQFTWKVVM